VNIILTNEITDGIVLCFFVEASNVEAYHCELLEFLHCSVVSSVLVLLLAHCSVICGTWHVRLLRSTPLLRWCTHNLSHHCIFLACCCVATAHLVDSTCWLLLLHLLMVQPLSSSCSFVSSWALVNSPQHCVECLINGRRINLVVQRGVCGFWVPMVSHSNSV
jgi:hypothetical protein